MKRYRLFVFPAVGMLLVLLGFLGYGLLNDSLVYFKTPTELMQVTPDTGRIRLGGEVMVDTVVQEEGAVAFEVGDGQTVVAVLHEGAPSQLFNEGIGVVVEGSGGASAEVLHDVALHVAATEPRFVNREEVTDDLLETEREIALKQAVEQGKSEEIAKRIVEGKMEKFFVSEVLLEQAFAKDASKSVSQHLTESSGDGATVVGFVRFKLGEGSNE